MTTLIRSEAISLLFLRPSLERLARGLQSLLLTSTGSATSMVSVALTRTLTARLGYGPSGTVRPEPEALTSRKTPVGRPLGSSDTITGSPGGSIEQTPKEIGAYTDRRSSQG